MTDFLEQVVAERRRDFPPYEASSDVEPTRDAVDNVWTGTSHGVPGGPELWRGFIGASAPVRYGDAFTAVLRARRMDGRLAVIAEVKRVSPAIGTLAEHVDPAAQAQRYAAAGAAAISVITEPRHWGGSLADLAAVRKAVPHVPVLCKDVIVSIHQITAARAAGADAVLLIAEALSDDELRRFAQRARELNMGALVEAHEPLAFGRAVACGALVVGANARNLRRPKEIDVGRARELQTFPRDDQIFVAESGIESVDDARLLPARVDAVLVGTALMRADDPAPLISAISGIRRGSQRTSVTVEP